MKKFATLSYLYSHSELSLELYEGLNVVRSYRDKDMDCKRTIT